MYLKKSAIKHWYAVYTRSRAEKKVANDLHLQDIECFLPLQKKLRQWKDRKKWVETPLLPGYCFVHVSRKEYDRVLQTDNVVCYITFEGKAAMVRNEQIEGLKTLLKQNEFDVEITRESFEPGKKVEIIKGPLMGLQGELCEIRGKHKFMLRIAQIDKSLMIEVPADYLSAVPESSFLS